MSKRILVFAYTLVTLLTDFITVHHNWVSAGSAISPVGSKAKASGGAGLFHVIAAMKKGELDEEL